MTRYLLLTLALGTLTWALSTGCDESPAQPDHEADCTNFVDDDGDSMIDCDDDDCFDHVACNHETICDDRVDNDGDGEVDCDDPDCRDAAVCNVTPDGDADSDEDEDIDVDQEEDADPGEVVNGGCCGEITLTPECGRDCSEDPYFNRCERGVCTNDGNTRECCVSRFCTCCATMSVGTVHDNLQIHYRGFFDNNHRCGFDPPFFIIQTRGEACDPGFVRIQMRVPWGIPDIGEERRLCGDLGMGDMQIMATVTDLDGTQVNYQNRECERPGSLVITEYNDESIRFRVEGSLSELDRDYRPTGRTVEIDVESFVIRRAEI